LSGGVAINKSFIGVFVSLLANGLLSSYRRKKNGVARQKQKRKAAFIHVCS
jgi:hypothetical protein